MGCKPDASKQNFNHQINEHRANKHTMKLENCHPNKLKICQHWTQMLCFSSLFVLIIWLICWSWWALSSIVTLICHSYQIDDSLFDVPKYFSFDFTSPWWKGGCFFVHRLISTSVFHFSFSGLWGVCGYNIGGFVYILLFSHWRWRRRVGLTKQSM